MSANLPGKGSAQSKCLLGACVILLFDHSYREMTFHIYMLNWLPDHGLYILPLDSVVVVDVELFNQDLEFCRLYGNEHTELNRYFLSNSDV